MLSLHPGACAESTPREERESAESSTTTARTSTNGSGPGSRGTEFRLHRPTTSRPDREGPPPASVASSSRRSLANPLPYPALARLATTEESLALGSARRCLTRRAKSVASWRNRSYDAAAVSARSPLPLLREVSATAEEGWALLRGTRTRIAWEREREERRGDPLEEKAEPPPDPAEVRADESESGLKSLLQRQTGSVEMLVHPCAVRPEKRYARIGKGSAGSPFPRMFDNRVVEPPRLARRRDPVAWLADQSRLKVTLSLRKSQFLARRDLQAENDPSGVPARTECASKSSCPQPAAPPLASAQMPEVQAAPLAAPRPDPPRPLRPPRPSHHTRPGRTRPHPKAVPRKAECQSGAEGR